MSVVVTVRNIWPLIKESETEIYCHDCLFRWYLCEGEGFKGFSVNLVRKLKSLICNLLKGVGNKSEAFDQDYSL